MRTTTVHAAALAAALAALALGAAAVASAAGTPSGSLSIENGRGIIEIKGQGQMIGRVGRGTLLIIDLTPRDKFASYVNGVARGTSVTWRGNGGSFRILGGRYRVVMRGEGISVAARGKGTATLDGEPDATGAGVFGVGENADCSGTAQSSCEPLPEIAKRVAFGSDAVGVKGASS